VTSWQAAFIAAGACDRYIPRAVPAGGDTFPVTARRSAACSFHRGEPSVSSADGRRARIRIEGVAREALPDELQRYRVGARVRRLRLKKKISLEELGRHTGLSPALLSKLERDQVMPTLPTLVRVALVFGVGLDEFFTLGEPGAAVVRAKDRLRFPERPEGDSAYEFESLDYEATGREMNAYLAEFHHEQTAAPHAHDAAEFLFVLAGTLTVDVETTAHVLGPGDSIYIRPSIPHGYTNSGDGPCRAVVVTTAASAATPAG
jgi:quercetin dioxygenase-like cupin family protein